MDSRSTFRPRSSAVMSQGGTQEGRPTGGWSSRAKRVGGGPRQIRGLVNAETRARAGLHARRSGSAHTAKKSLVARLAGARTANRHRWPGTQRAKARERTLVKELGKMTP